MTLRDDLVRAINDTANVLFEDNYVVIIADAFPKSIHHYLVLPKEDIADVRSLKQHHIPKLIYMQVKGLDYVKRVTGLLVHDLLVGYHAYPSMNRLHLHVLSKDFCGVHLKKPFQWNTFQTEFFLPTYKIISDLQTIGHVNLPDKKCLNKPLQCNKCNYFSNDIQNLKLHLTLFHATKLHQRSY